MTFDPITHPHRRYNPLTNEHILVSPHRNKRPWLGQVEPLHGANLPQYDLKCYLCPGNDRSNGQKNPKYEETFTFENDFPSVLHPPAPEAPVSSHPLMIAEPVSGACDILIFHPRHDLTMSRLAKEEIERIIAQWIHIYETRGAKEGIEYVQIFENKGQMMGCSNPHPHGQIWSLSVIPTIPAQELRSLQRYSRTISSHMTALPTRPCLLCDYAKAELEEPENKGRIVVFNEHWLAVVPWWATWPFEILLLPHARHIESISQLDEKEKSSFADVLSRITKRYDNLFSCSFPYSMGLHQRPVPSGGKGGDDLDDSNFAHLHLHFEPPLLRGSNVRKFLVGYEMMAEPQRDLTPEQAAERLRQCSDVHYLDANLSRED